MNLLELIDDNCQRFPNLVACTSSEGRLTYGELKAQSDAVAHNFNTILGRTIQTIAVIGHKTPKMLSSFLAAWKAGRAYVPIDTATTPPDRITSIVQQSLSWRLFAEMIGVPSHPVKIVLPPIDDLAPAYIIFTSGSSGEPKGVVIPHEALHHFVEVMTTMFDFKPRETWLNVASWSFDLSILDTYVCLATAGRLFSLTREEASDPTLFVPRLYSSGIVNWVSTPSFADLCLTIPTFSERMLPHVKRFFFCGEPLRRRTVVKLTQRFPNARFYNMYGPTEACCAVTITPVTAKDDEPLPCGHAFPDMTIRTDPSSSPTGSPVPGEVIIMGPQVALGYVGRSSEMFFTIDGVRGYRTGDRGLMTSSGQLLVNGRLDRQVKVFGNRVELGEVETAISKITGVDAVAVVQPTAGTSLRAYVKGDLESSAIKFALRRTLPSYMVPRSIVVRDSMPLTPNGKIDVQALTKEEHVGE